MKNRLILASASPRRRELLTQIGLEFEILPSKGEESITREKPCEIVMELATCKAQEIFDIVKDDTKDMQSVVIGADTIVVHNGRIMGKPADAPDAEAMLTELCGDVHQVYTGVALLWADKDEQGTQTVRSKVFYECTDVYVYPASAEEIKAYVATGDPLDKAGAYGIQGRFAAFIRKIDGDYNNVVGLPVGRVYRELKAEGLI